VSEQSEENYISIDDGIKSIPISELEECIASAIANAVNTSKLSCHVRSLKTYGVQGIKITLELSNDYSDIEF